MWKRKRTQTRLFCCFALWCLMYHVGSRDAPGLSSFPPRRSGFLSVGRRERGWGKHSRRTETGRRSARQRQHSTDRLREGTFVWGRSLTVPADLESLQGFKTTWRKTVPKGTAYGSRELGVACFRLVPQVSVQCVQSLSDLDLDDDSLLGVAHVWSLDGLRGLSPGETQALPAAARLKDQGEAEEDEEDEEETVLKENGTKGKQKEGGKKGLRDSAAGLKGGELPESLILGIEGGQGAQDGLGWGVSLDIDFGNDFLCHSSAGGDVPVPLLVLQWGVEVLASVPPPPEKGKGIEEVEEKGRGGPRLPSTPMQARERDMKAALARALEGAGSCGPHPPFRLSRPGPFEAVLDSVHPLWSLTPEEGEGTIDPVRWMCALAVPGKEGEGETGDGNGEGKAFAWIPVERPLHDDLCEMTLGSGVGMESEGGGDSLALGEEGEGRRDRSWGFLRHQLEELGQVFLPRVQEWAEKLRPTVRVRRAVSGGEGRYAIGIGIRLGGGERETGDDLAQDPISEPSKVFDERTDRGEEEGDFGGKRNMQEERTEERGVEIEKSSASFSGGKKAGGALPLSESNERVARETDEPLGTEGNPFEKLPKQFDGHKSASHEDGTVLPSGGEIVDQRETEGDGFPASGMWSQWSIEDQKRLLAIPCPSGYVPPARLSPLHEARLKTLASFATSDGAASGSEAPLALSTYNPRVMSIPPDQKRGRPIRPKHLGHMVVNPSDFDLLKVDFLPFEVASDIRRRVEEGRLFLPQPDEGFYLAVNKPKGPSSNQVLTRIKNQFLRALQTVGACSRREMKSYKAGHGGTLDPFASGLLILGFGRPATRYMGDFIHGKKIYRTVVQLGEEREGYDETGKLVATAPFDHVTVEQVRDVIATQFTGEILQRPPAYSAKKIGGTPSYLLARTGKVTDEDLAPLPKTIYRLEILYFEPPFLALEVECSSGFYVRSLGYDLAKALGTVGHLKELVRTATGPFTVENALTCDKWSFVNIINHLVPAEGYVQIREGPDLPFSKTEINLRKERERSRGGFRDRDRDRRGGAPGDFRGRERSQGGGRPWQGRGPGGGRRTPAWPPRRESFRGDFDSFDERESGWQGQDRGEYSRGGYDLSGDSFQRDDRDWYDSPPPPRPPPRHGSSFDPDDSTGGGRAQKRRRLEEEATEEEDKDAGEGDDEPENPEIDENAGEGDDKPEPEIDENALEGDDEPEPESQIDENAGEGDDEEENPES
uniref:tRNA pseudouridine(55) synthase n=1 Tax=Chromera velia CCMP2878 TaxID=1169474 RepID=A0A0G4GXM5_9ALVE|eukprot:Cvel_5346.t1-p1 / transcript=Cvel_5346.t1 / gene=Cvel_5346 / organism=Chromera_velia_CCMP2878 / gene_product=Probable tRNA pseudouridine synthase 1, putative / transcript_product=Probable tRNA pseudouridine synthase 1, putative / location=Cvel_scaffold248:5757-18905(+) / protein_length=1224 / sequence_SO=supercontig / SO=protein_coding / is_pseudo=false